MTIKVGDKIPSAILMTMIFALALDTPQDHDMAEYWAREAIDRHGATGAAYGLVSPADLAVASDLVWVTSLCGAPNCDISRASVRAYDE